jgi:hypothetical protein
MTVGARQNIAAALVVLVRRPEIGIAAVIAGGCPAMLFRLPVNLVKVSSKLRAVNVVFIVVTVCTKGHIIRHIGAVLLASAIGFILSLPPLVVIVWRKIHLVTGITVHPLRRVPTIYTPTSVMGARKGHWRCAAAAYRVIMLLGLMRVMTRFTWVNVVQRITKSPPTFQEIFNILQVMGRTLV